MTTPPAHDDEVTPEQEAAVTRDIDDAFRAFALRLRKDVGHPMTELEWSLARLAHCDGYVEGVQSGIRLAGLEPPIAPDATDGGTL